MADRIAPDCVGLDVLYVRLDDNGIVTVELNSGVDFTLEAARQYVDACVRLCNGTPRPFLIIEPAHPFESSPEVREFLAQNTSLRTLRKALAIVAGDFPNRLAAKAYLNFNKPVEHGRLFSKQEDAIAWLKHYL